MHIQPSSFQVFHTHKRKKNNGNITMKLPGTNCQNREVTNSVYNRLVFFQMQTVSTKTIVIQKMKACYTTIENENRKVIEISTERGYWGNVHSPWLLFTLHGRLRLRLTFQKRCCDPLTTAFNNYKENLPFQGFSGTGRI